MTEIAKHYDMLVDEGNDPFYDPPVLREYMNRWDGQVFLDSMHLDDSKSVLEIGVGTGRIAAKVALHCSQFTGIDISPKTIEKAKYNLRAYSNIILVCDDFLSHRFETTYDVVYSSLTMMHFEDKRAVINKAETLLKSNGIFCLSIDKNQSTCIDMGSRKITVFPDLPENIVALVSETSLKVASVREIENAFIIVCTK